MATVTNGMATVTNGMTTTDDSSSKVDNTKSSSGTTTIDSNDGNGNVVHDEIQNDGTPKTIEYNFSSTTTQSSGDWIVIVIVVFIILGALVGIGIGIWKFLKLRKKRKENAAELMTTLEPSTSPIHLVLSNAAPPFATLPLSSAPPLVAPLASLAAANATTNSRLEKIRSW